ncbi:MAG: recombinase family protein [Mucinivorans sp.]
MGTIGYIRLRKDQSIDEATTEAFNQHDVDQIVSGDDPLSVVQSMADGQTLVVNSLSDFSCGLNSLLLVLAAISERHIKLISIHEPWLDLDPKKYQWHKLFQGLAQFNSRILSERTKIALAKKRDSGCKLGRPQGSKVISDQSLRQGLQLYREHAMSVREICEKLHLNVRSFYRYIKEQQAIG